MCTSLLIAKNRSITTMIFTIYMLATFCLKSIKLFVCTSVTSLTKLNYLVLMLFPIKFLTRSTYLVNSVHISQVKESVLPDPTFG